MEPDEDEDPTRMCAKCGQRPRWSKHMNCRNCVVCSGKKVSYCILRRKKDAPVATPEQLRENRRQRQRNQYGRRTLGS